MYAVCSKAAGKWWYSRIHGCGLILWTYGRLHKENGAAWTHWGVSFAADVGFFAQSCLAQAACCIQSMSDTLWHHVVPCDTSWYHVIPCDTMWYLVTPCGYLVVFCGTMWYLMTSHDTMWYHAIPCDALWYHVIPCGHHLYPVSFANRPDVWIARNNSLSVGVQQPSKRCVALEVPNDHFGGNTNLHTPACKQSQEQHQKKVQLSKKPMYHQKNILRFTKIMGKTMTW